MQGEVFERRDVLLSDGIVIRIANDISPDSPDLMGGRVFFLPGCHLLPGLCDVHVHFRVPGNPEKETVATGTRAAAAGGFTAVCAMPNLSPAPDSLEHLAVQQQLIKKDALVQVLPYGCITQGRLGKQLVDMPALAGRVAGFSDDGSGVQGNAMMREAMLLAKSCGSFICAHCEDESLLHGGVIHAGGYAQSHGLPGIASESEWGQLKRDLELAQATGARYHACHMSTRESVQLLREAKAKGLPVSGETAPHYLMFCDDDLQDDGGFKMNPPIRAKEDREALLQAVADGTLEVIATDHAPHTAEEKSRGLAASLNGVVGLETSFAACYTTLVKSGRMPLHTLVQRMSTTPRQLVGLANNAIAEGQPLDAVAVDLDVEWTVDPQQFFSMGRSTPFAGKRLFGRPVATWADGRLVHSALPKAENPVYAKEAQP